MDLKGEFISKAVEIAAGVVVGYISYAVSARTSDLAGMFGVMTGLMTTMVVAILVESYRHAQDIRDSKASFITLTEKIAQKHQDTWDFAQVLRYGTTTIPNERVIDVVIQLLWRIKHRVLATSYVSPDVLWGRSYSALYHEIERAKIRVNKASITRIFIIDTQEELTQLRNVMSRQQEAGIKIKYIFKKTIDHTPTLKRGVATIESLDFDVFDDRLVLFVPTDKKRGPKYGKILFGKEECERYKRFHDYLFEEAEEIEWT
ncbi:hypothetical protein AMJ87_07015 [candidate division WOR_3 bacterium SM23_60]|uniref:Uncharacterized protein n=1 Tax=candidate division WOR_3 bacterium SM23_60 TaxID=1703780 RepID=A0A0S8GEZ9_UNCW3|nr:MAG: hypothetical protein AMJ87_07015 [candidate division WOR_3 bacterium SM23_60]